MLEATFTLFPPRLDGKTTDTPNQNQANSLRHEQRSTWPPSLSSSICFSATAARISIRHAGQRRPIHCRPMEPISNFDSGTAAADRKTAPRWRRPLSPSLQGWRRRGRVLLFIKNTQHTAQSGSRKSCPIDSCSHSESSDSFYSIRSIAFGYSAIHVFVCDFVAIFFPVQGMRDMSFRDRWICGAKALLKDSGHCSAKGLGMCAQSAHRETAGAVMPDSSATSRNRSTVWTATVRRDTVSSVSCRKSSEKVLRAGRGRGMAASLALLQPAGRPFLVRSYVWIPTRTSSARSQRASYRRPSMVC
jgi:hypothetical protein